jgi:hypothetical protein
MRLESIHVDTRERDAEKERASEARLSNRGYRYG